jgi:hypothetical protein
VEDVHCHELWHWEKTARLTVFYQGTIVWQLAHRQVKLSISNSVRRQTGHALLDRSWNVKGDLWTPLGIRFTGVHHHDMLVGDHMNSRLHRRIDDDCTRGCTLIRGTEEEPSEPIASEESFARGNVDQLNLEVALCRVRDSCETLLPVRF